MRMRSALGTLLCACGLHAVRTMGHTPGYHPVKACQRPGCHYRYLEFWGGCRLMIKGKNDA